MDDPFAALEARRMKRDQERMEINKRLAQINAEASEDAVALRVLRQIFPENAPTEKATTVSLSVAVRVHSSVVAQLQQQQSDMRVKEMILAILRDAAPDGLTAAQIKGKAAIKYKKDINKNTLTVSLVRASKEKGDEPALVQCRERVWYYLGKSKISNVRAPELALTGASAAVLNGGNEAAE